MHYIGWDLHQRFSQLAVKTKNGQLLKELKIPHFPGIFQHPIVIKLFSSPTKVAVEACNGWYWVADGLEELGAEVHLAHPLKTKLIAEAKVKTDKIDAKILADLLRTDFLPESYLAPSLVREKRELHRHRAALVKVRTSIKNRVHGILGKHGIFFTDVTDIFGVKGRQQLQKQLTNLKPVYRGELKRYLSLIDWLDKEIEKIEDEISSTVKKAEITELLMTIPGIGEYSAYLIQSEISTVFLGLRSLSPMPGLIRERIFLGNIFIISTLLNRAMSGCVGY